MTPDPSYTGREGESNARTINGMEKKVCVEEGEVVVCCANQ